MGRVLLLADHVWLAETIALLLEQRSGGTLRVVSLGTVANPPLDALDPAQIEIVLLVVGVDALSAQNTAAAVRLRLPRVPIVGVDTMGEISRVQLLDPHAFDALLSVEQLLDRLVPVILSLISAAQPVDNVPHDTP